MGKPWVSGSRAISATMCMAMGLTAGPQYPPCVPLPSIIGSGLITSRLTEVIELMVLMRDTASAPPALAARAELRISVMFGVSFTMTGRE